MSRILFIIPILLMAYGSYAQEEDTLVFAKGRFLTSLYGSLTNQQVDIKSGGDVTSIGYTIGTKSGTFIKNKWVLGVNFSLSKSDFSDPTLNLVAEDLNLGIWTRVYFAHQGSVALYAELTPYFTSIFRQNIITTGGVPLSNEEVTGSGFGILPGFGFTYLLNRSVGFGMTLSAPFAIINAETKDLILNTKTSNTIHITNLQFGFNFQIYIDQFFF